MSSRARLKERRLGRLVEHGQNGALAHPIESFADVKFENSEGGLPFLGELGKSL